MNITMNKLLSSTGKTAVILLTHGAPTCVDDIPLYLKNIRGGTESSPEVIQIIRDRYKAIGGSSPLLEITQGQAKELENLTNKAKENNTILLTTEKDYLRISENYKHNINYLKIEVEIENRNQFIDEIKKII